MMDDAMWGMILGKSGKIPGTIAPEIVELAKQQGREFTDADPRTLIPNALDDFRKEMDENGWEYGQDDEELYELAMHPEQYRAYKSGKAKADFEKDLAERKAKKNAPSGAAQPDKITVSVNGQTYEVNIAYGDAAPAPTAAAAAAPVGEGEDLLAPLEGKFYLVKDGSETPKKVGDAVKEGDTLGYIEAMKTFNAIRADKAGVITAILVNSGDSVEEDDPIMKLA